MLLAVAFCADPPVRSWPKPTMSSAPQDVLTITVFGEAELSGKYTVEQDGTFTFPQIGRVKAGGTTLRELEAGAEDQARRRVSQEPAGGGRDRELPQPAHPGHG